MKQELDKDEDLPQPPFALSECQQQQMMTTPIDLSTR